MRKITMDSKIKIMLGILIIGVILVGGWWIWNIQTIQPPENITQSELKISVDGNLETIADIQLPVDEIEAKKIVKKFCEAKNPDYVYGYDMMEEVDDEWRIPVYNVNCPCYATVNIKTGETNCMKQIPFETQEVTISTDKTEYEQGETVKAILGFSEDIYVNPYIKIYELENNDWKYLGDWTFDSTQYTCCGAISPCEKNTISKSPLEIKWDQKMVKEPLPILPGKPMTKIQVNSGKYKIRVIYGNQEVCTNGVDTEFTIKEKINCRDENYECTIEDIPCCSGLKGVLLTYEDEEGQCFPPVPCGSICLPCGNDVCDERENRCNCPEDCK